MTTPDRTPAALPSTGALVVGDVVAITPPANPAEAPPPHTLPSATDWAATARVRYFVVLLAPDASLGEAYADVRVAALSWDVGRAADQDLVLAADAWVPVGPSPVATPRTPFMVECWNSRPTLVSLAGRAVGRLSDAALAALHAFVAGDDAGVARHGGASGSAIVSADDGRLAFQVDEVRATAALSYAVFERLQALEAATPAAGPRASRARGARPSPLFAPPTRWRRATRAVVHPVPATLGSGERAFG